MGVVKRGRGEPFTLFAPGGPSQDLMITLRRQRRSPETGAADHVRWFLRRFPEANEQELRREVSREGSLAANLNTSSTDQGGARRLRERAQYERDQEAPGRMGAET